MGYLLNPNLGGFTETKRVSFVATTYNDMQVRLVLTTSNFDYTKTTVDGVGIRFTSTATADAEAACLPYWIESWAYNGTSVVWFKVPTAGTSQVFLRYGHLGATDKQTAFTSFMDRGLRWTAYNDSTTMVKAIYGGNDTNLNQGSVGSASVAIAGQVLGAANGSARWEGWLLPEIAGDYTLGHSDDDGGRMWLNDSLIYNDWTPAAGEVKNTVTLTPAPQKYVREWHDSGGGSGAYAMGVGARTGRRTNLCVNPSFEVDLGWWAVLSNCTLARVTTDSCAGAASMEVTLTSTSGAARYWAGNDIMQGSAYTFSYYCKATSGTPTMQAAIYWHDRDGNYISGSTGTAAASTTGWTRYTVTGTAPANARGAMLLVSSTVSANGNKVLIDGVLLEQSGSAGTYFDGTWVPGGWNGTAHASSSYFDAAARVNLAINPNFDNTSAIPYTDHFGWEATTSPGQTSVVATSGGYVGPNYLKMTRADSTGRLGIITPKTPGDGGLTGLTIPASAGEVFSVSAYVKSPNYTGNVQARIRFEDAKGTILLNTSGTNVVCSTAWQRVTHTLTAPAGAVYAKFTIQSNTTNDMTVGQELHIDGVLAERAGSAGVYFDGGYPPSSWWGTAPLQFSVQYPTDRVNLAVNPGFTNNVDSWQVSSVTSPNASIQWVSTGGRTNGGFMRVTRLVDVAVTPVGAGATQTNAALAMSPCIPGVTYTASGYAKSANNTRSAYVRLSFYDASFAEINSTLSGALTLSTAWQRISVSAAAPAGAMYVGIRTSSGNNFTTNETIDWDDMMVEAAASAGAYFDGSIAGSTWVGAANASASVRPTSNTTVTYPFPLSWVWGPKFDPNVRGPVFSSTAVVGNTPVGLDAALPQDVTLWLDMSDVSVFTKDGSNNVSAVADKSGLARNFAVGGTGVTYVASAQNSKSVCRMGGSGYLGNTAHAAALVQATMTVILAAKSSDAADKDFIFYAKNGVAGPEAGTVYNGGGATAATAIEIDLGFDATDNPSFSWGDAQTVVVNQFASRANTTNPKVFGVRVKPNTIPQIILNAATNPTAGTYGATPPIPCLAPTFVSIGSHGSNNDTLTRWLNGDVYEVLVWSRYLTDAEITAVTNYLYAKWGVSP